MAKLPRRYAIEHFRISCPTLDDIAEYSQDQAAIALRFVPSNSVSSWELVVRRRKRGLVSVGAPLRRVKGERSVKVFRTRSPVCGRIKVACRSLEA